MQTVYIAHPDYVNELCHELTDVSSVVGNLVFSTVQKTTICFALDVWLEPKIETIESISQAVKLLRQAGKYWVLNPVENIRRSRLIEAELRKSPPIPCEFPVTETLPAIGCFSLLDKNTLVYTARRWKQPPTGYYLFKEDKVNPPNRAYLKLWEALSLLGEYPTVGETAIDLGASPGGWTYVMQTLGVQVTGVDKAPLDPSIAKLHGVSFMQQSAFALEPASLSKPVDWLLCDVACYPERTYELVTRWIASGQAKKFIFTIKLQGDTDFGILEKFAEIPGARIIHLFQNKHEVTFFYPATELLSPHFNP
jgi:23S rRNA (cytidine2498-2'-O)-methyltransferase